MERVGEENDRKIRTCVCVHVSGRERESVCVCVCVSVCGPICKSGLAAAGVQKMAWRQRVCASERPLQHQFESIVAVPALILWKEDECSNSSHIMFLRSQAAIEECSGLISILE